MADGDCNNEQPQEIPNNLSSLPNGLLNESSMLSDTTIGSRTSLFKPKLPRPLTLNVTQELQDWEDDSMKRTLGTKLYPLVKKFLTAKMLQSERNLHRFGGEMNQLRTCNERLTATVWDLVRKLVKAYEEIDLYKKRAGANEGRKHATTAATANGPKPHPVSAEGVLQTLRLRMEMLPGAENAQNGNGDLILDANDILEWSQREDGELNDLEQQFDCMDLHPAAIAKAAGTAVSPDFKQAAIAPMTDSDTYSDSDATLIHSRARSAIGDPERSGIGSVTLTTNSREDLEKSALEGESCFCVDGDRSNIIPSELDSFGLQTFMHQAVRSRVKVLSGAESAQNGNGEELVLEANDILKWPPPRKDKEWNDLQQQVDGVDLHPAAIAKAAVTAVSPDFKRAAVAAMTDSDTYSDSDATLVHSRARSAIGDPERSGIGSLTMKANSREDLDKSALEGESYLYVDADRSNIMPSQLDSFALQTFMHRACELGCVYFSQEHGDVRLTSDWHSHERNASSERHVAAFNAWSDFGDLTAIPALFESIAARLQETAAKPRSLSDPDRPADCLASLAFIGIVDPTKASVAISGDWIVFRQFEFPRGKHSLTLIKALHTNEPCAHSVDANSFSIAVMRLAVDVLETSVYSKNALRFDYKQLADRVARWLRQSCENVVVVSGLPSAFRIANGSALIGDPNSEHPASHLRYRSEEMGFEVHAWIF